jgi:predicted nucleic acid-binding protein
VRQPTGLLNKSIDNNIPFGIDTHIYLELLQGSRNESEYDILKEFLSALPFYELKYGKKSYENVARLNMKCREHGITIRSTIDLIIAETALENNLYLFHNDKDYTNMATVITELKIY